jgi:hypothetical protein
MNIFVYIILKVLFTVCNSDHPYESQPLADALYVYLDYCDFSQCPAITVIVLPNIPRPISFCTESSIKSMPAFYT